MANMWRSLPQCDGYLGIVVPGRKAKLASASDQRTVPEMWLSACVGCGSRKKRKRNQAHDVPKLARLMETSSKAR
jgi:cytochrome c553